MKVNNVLGIIGGSGIYDIDGLENPKWTKVDSAFGEPSDELLFGKFHNRDLVFLPRHGRGHKIPPADINYQANIEILKKSGVKEIISFGAVGSFKEELSPGTFVLIDQFIDRTIKRKKTFFGPGLTAHVQFAHPICSRLKNIIESSSKSLDLNLTSGGTYLAMEGPQFSTLAESNLYRSWKADVIGMTNMPEAKLAREAEIRYASVSMVTDYDCWHLDHENVDVQKVIKVLLDNAAKAKNMIKNLIDCFENHIDPKDPTNNCLDVAIITAPEKRSKKTIEKLNTVAGRVLNK